MTQSRHVCQPRVAKRGFTLIELVVTIALLGVLFSLAVPSFSAWINNAKVRSVADSLQNGLRVAQAESMRRNRQVVFSLTNAQPALGAAATANGKYWSVQTVAQFSDTAAEFLQGGALSDVASGVTITSPAVAVCFNSNGRLTTNATATGVPNANCAAANAEFVIAKPGADRSLSVRVGLGGQVRMCDPQRSASTSSDGC
jgi:type IV fimbrial biogenesis protein FimT